MQIPKLPSRNAGDSPRQGAFGGSYLIVAVIVAVACLSYWFGTYRAGQFAALSRVEKAQASRQSEECRQQTVNLSKGAEIDAAVLAQTRTEVAQGRARVARLEQDVTLYRSLVEGSVRTAGVSVHSLDIARLPDGEPQRYRYRMTLIQRAQRQVEVQGFASITVSGTRDGKAISIGLREFGERQSGNRVAVRFVYFQTLEGDFFLPEGFQPLQVRVQVEIRKGKPQQAERTFDWTVLEG